MARSRSGDLDFGSDSFLDIIANIVGILIILIVIAGLRVARTPVATEAPETTPVAAHQEPTPPPIPSIPPDFDDPRARQPLLLPPQPEPMPRIDAELPGRIAALRTEIETLKGNRSRSQAALQLSLIHI